MQADLYKALNDKKLNCPVFQSPLLPDKWQERVFIRLKTWSYIPGDTAYRQATNNTIMLHQLYLH